MKSPAFWLAAAATVGSAFSLYDLNKCKKEAEKMEPSYRKDCRFDWSTPIMFTGAMVVATAIDSARKKR